MRVLIIFLLMGCLTLANAANDRIVQKVGQMEFVYTKENGASLTVFGVPMMKDSAFWVAKPMWAGHHYGAIYQPDLIKNATIEDYQGGKKITLHHELPSPKQDYIKGTEVFILLPNNTYRTELEFIIPKSDPGVYEWSIGSLNAIAFIGRKYSVYDGISTFNGTIPVDAPCKDPGGIADIAESTYGRAFKSMTIYSALGPITLSTDTEDDFILFDHRKAQWSQYGEPWFWLGRLERDIEEGKHLSYKMTIQFPEKLSTQLSQSTLTGKTKLTTQSDILAPNYEKSAIVPTPKKIVWTQTLFPLNSKTVIYAGKKSDSNMENAVNFFLRDLNTIYNITPQVVWDTPPLKTRDNIIILENQPSVPIPPHKEGYRISSRKNLVRVSGHDSKGVFYGLTSLLQMIKVNPKGVFIKGAEITDYPSMDFRGYHTFTSHDDNKAMLKFAEDIWGRYKLNYWVWQTDFLIWDSATANAHPEKSMALKEGMAVAEVAQKHFVEIIPCLQTYGHGEWLFTNNQNMDFAEDSTVKDINLYCAANPKAHEFIFNVMDEAIKLFKPKYFHINMDEIELKGGGPLCRHQPGKSDTDIILGEASTYHAWLKDRGIETMMWSDVFLAKGEAPDAANAPSLEESKKRRDGLSKEIIITDWHYAPVKPELYSSLTVWKNEGFRVIGCSWYMPNDIRNLARANYIFNTMGHLQSTWAGHSLTFQEKYPSTWHQWWNFIIAGHYAWTGEDKQIKDLDWTPSQEFIDVWFQKKPRQDTHSGFMVDLSSLVNRSLADNTKLSGWAGYGPQHDLSAFPIKQNRFGETCFKISRNKNGQSAVLLSGLFNPKGNFPATVDIPLNNQKASELRFLINSIYPTQKNKECGEIQIQYQDGSSAVKKLIYWENLWSFDDVFGSRDTRVVWKGFSRAGMPVGVRELIWTNPSPEKSIKSVTVKSYNTEAAPVLLGLTGVNL